MQPHEMKSNEIAEMTLDIPNLILFDDFIDYLQLKLFILDRTSFNLQTIIC